MAKKGFQQIETAHGTRFRAQFTDPTTGRRYSITAESPAELEAARRKFREARAGIKAGIPAAALIAGLPGHVDPGMARVGEIFASYLASLQDRSRKKAESYSRRNLDLLINYRGSRIHLFDLSACELLPAVMGAWLVEARKTGGLDGNGRAWYTVRTAYHYLASAYHWARIPGPWDPWRPMRGRPQGRHGERPAARSWEEARGIVAAALEEDADQLRRGTYADRGARALVAICTGCRNGELAALAWDDLQGLDAGGDVVLTVRHQAPAGWQHFDGAGARPVEPPKGRRGQAKQRSQILEPIAVTVLRAMRAEQIRRGWYRPDGPIFGDNKGGLWTWRTAGIAIKPSSVRRWAERAGIPDAARWTTHCLKHTTISLMFAAGADPRTVQHKGGHADLSTTMGYYHRLGYGLPRPMLSEGLGGMALLGPVVQGLPEHVPAERAAELDAPIELARSSEPPVSKVRRSPREEPRRTFAALADAWLRGEGARTMMGRKLPRPAEVTAEAKRNASRAYRKPRHELGPAGKAEAAAAYRKSYRATLARWARELRDAERRAQRPAPASEPATKTQPKRGKRVLRFP
jgi:integrase